MAKRHARPASSSPARAGVSSLADRATWLIVCATTVALPLVLLPGGKDGFRLPKQAFLITSGIALAAIATCAVVLKLRTAPPTRWWTAESIVIGALLAWSVVTTALSTNVALSISSLVFALSAVVLFVAAHDGAQRRPLFVVYYALAPAALNGLIALWQRTSSSNPLTTSTEKVMLLTGETTVGAQAALEQRLHVTALVGNPDDVAMFLLAPTLAAVALAFASAKHRKIAVTLAVAMLLGMIASESLGAILALGTGLFLLIFAYRPRAAVATAVIAAVLGFVAIEFSPHRLAVTRAKIAALAAGDFDAFTSGRLPPFLAAWEMFRQHPIVGVGPGCFVFHYFDAKLQIEPKHPAIVDRSFVNFAETHNEHLQVLAEGGVPAYMIFVAAFTILARNSFMSSSRFVDDRANFARLLAAPLAISFAVLSLSSFPLRLAAPTANAAFIAALISAWSTDARD